MGKVKVNTAAHELDDRIEVMPFEDRNFNTSTPEYGSTRKKPLVAPYFIEKDLI